MYYIGIDLGGTNIVCGIVDVNGKLLAKKSCKTRAERPANEIVSDMVQLSESVIFECGLKKEKIAFCGIGTPGIANAEKGILEYSCNLPSFQNFDLVSEMRALTGFSRISIDNDANCAAKGEAEAGAAKNSKNSVLITLGTGVGGGIILDGKVYHGMNFAGGELGHMVIQAGGVPCSCGRQGCWETYSSATALCRMTREEMLQNPKSIMWSLCENDIDKVSGRTAFDARRKGDESAKAVLDRFTYYFAVGITNVINIFQPEIVSVGGGISAEGEELLAPVRAIVEREEYSRNCKKKTVLKKAELGNDAGIIGAALLWR
ncbi:MAG: ROK family protein [Clostridia bacterium]|nr:ROK family protein [Clostridia bacterium]